MQKTRRDFLWTAGTGIAAGLISAKTGLALDSYPAVKGGLRIRKDVTSAAAAGDLEALKVGVQFMKQIALSNPSDHRGWINQAYIHGDCADFTFCQHGNWFFAPWHRSMIYYFEELIRHYSRNENFALPYWDWSRTHGVPASFYGSGNSLDDTVSIASSCQGAPAPGRGQAVTDQFTQTDLDTYVGSERISEIQSNPDYSTWGGAASHRGVIEGTPHNFVHRWVGGEIESNMVQTFSPLDPIFWLHHCNIDRLYSNWLARGFSPPGDSTWQNKSFNDFYDRDGKPAGSKFTCGMTLDSGVMGYTYDRILDLPESLAARRGAAAPEILETVSATQGQLAAGALSFAVKAPARSTRQRLNAVASDVGNFAVRLRIDGVKTPKRQNTGVHVFLGPKVTPDTPSSAPGYVGSFTFFEGEGRQRAARKHDHGNGTFVLDATRALQSLYGDASLPEGDLTVSIVTRPLYQGVKAFGSVEEIKPESVHFEVVDLKR